MAGILLVHGPWFGGWQWDRLAPILEQMGHEVIAEDMPGCGDDPVPKESVTMQMQLDHLSRLADRIPGPVHVVGHGASGIIVTEFAERNPAKVASVIYISAVTGPPGEPALILPMNQSAQSSTIFTDKGAPMTLNRDLVADLVSHDCPEDVRRVVRNRVEETSYDPPMAPLPHPARHWAKMQKGYIICLDSRVVLRAQQFHMTIRHSCSPVVKMNTGHCPFLVHPEKTARHIEDMVFRVADPAMVDHRKAASG